MRDSVLILDFGSQFTQLITRRIRELGLFSEIKPCHISPDSVDTSKIQALILSGGPAGVTDSDAPKFDRRWLELGLPTLGVCYGMQLISHIFGAKLGKGAAREYGRATLEIKDNTDLFSSFDLGEKTTVWMSHGDHVETVAPGFTLLASSKNCEVTAIADRERKIYAVLFHPEVVHTARGTDLLSNFIFKIAKLKKNWSSEGFIADSVERIRNAVGSTNVICGLSGGVDSSVAAALVSKAIGNQLHCLFIDNGLLRKHEAQEVMDRLGSSGLGLNVKLIDASSRFLSELKGVTDPEKKRKIIGRVFIEVFDEEAHKISNVTHLVQGTLYPDVVESMSVRGGPSTTIKTHHNVGGLPEKMKLKLIEPFRELFKDEVRRLGAELGISDDILYRHPFPGPGLAVRVLGDITPERLKITRDADAIFIEELRAEGLYRSIWQAFAALLPVQSVGVMGDGRTYEQVAALRAVYSEDGMTADWVDLPVALLKRVSSRIINEVKGINRVVYDISSKPPSTIEWE